MKSVVMLVEALIAGAWLAGCQNSLAPGMTSDQLAGQMETRHNTVVKKRSRTATQIQILREFAMKESPKTWQTVQTMRGEIEVGDRKITQLRADFLELGRNPDSDKDFRAIIEEQEHLRNAYYSILDHLEDAYIAAKKYEAAPSRKDYHEAMRRAIEDGVQEATMATERYKTMSRQK